MSREASVFLQIQSQTHDIQKMARKIKHENINGVIRIINQRNPERKLCEKIYVGILLKSMKSDFEVENWQIVLTKSRPIEGLYEKFSVTRDSWNNGGKVFVVPTDTFEQTKIEIFIHENAVLGMGFEMELFHRNNIKKVKFLDNKSAPISMGGTITILIRWQMIKQEEKPAIKFSASDVAS